MQRFETAADNGSHTITNVETHRLCMARNLGHSAEGVAGSEIIASLKIQLKIS